MALWQYKFFVLPKESVEALTPDYNFEKDEDENWFDEEPYWKLNPVNRNFFYDVSKFVKQRKSWSKEIDLYGNQESNCFEVFFENNMIVSVSFRIDFTSNYESVLNQIIEFCILKGLIILDEELNVIPLNFEVAKNVIENAPQVKKYNQLSKKDKSPE